MTKSIKHISVWLVFALFGLMPMVNAQSSGPIALVKTKPKQWPDKQDRAEPPADFLQKITYEGKELLIGFVQPDRQSLELHNTGNKPLDFKAHAEKKSTLGEELIFAIAIGGLDEKGRPLGMVFKDGKVRQRGSGFKSGTGVNFDVLKGIFAMKKTKVPVIAPSATFKKSSSSNYNYAIESSPMLLTKGKIDPTVEKSEAKAKYSAMFILPNQEIGFVISKSNVSYGFLAKFIKTELKGVDAIILRNDKPSYYTPGLGVVNENSNALGPLLMISKNSEIIKPQPEVYKEEAITKELKKAIFLGKEYIICEVDTKNYDIVLHNEIKNGKGIHDFTSIQRDLNNKGKQQVFSMNAGMYDNSLRPIGLYLSKGEIFQDVNLNQRGHGNFYDLPPNGVFSIDEKGKAGVHSTRDYVQKYEPSKQIQLATQSGPMMVINGTFNKAFNEGSANLNLRNGVGVDDKGKVFFVISSDPVNFYEFSQLFRDQLNCNNALYLDGFVSQWYAPKINEQVNRNRPLGPIISVLKK